MATKYKMSNGQRILMTDAEEADLIVKSLNIENNKKKNRSTIYKSKKK